MAERVNQESFTQKVLESELPVLVDFYSDSCVPCKKMSPLVGGVEDDYAGKLNVYKVNTNFDSELTEQYEVQSVPTLIIFKGGEEASRITGAVKKAELRTWVDEQIQ